MPLPQKHVPKKRGSQRLTLSVVHVQRREVVAQSPSVCSRNSEATWFTSHRQGAAFNLMCSASFVPDGIDGLVLIKQEFLPRNDISVNYGHASFAFVHNGPSAVKPARGLALPLSGGMGRLYCLPLTFLKVCDFY